MILASYEFTIVNQIIEGCKKIVDEEEIVYRKSRKVISTNNNLRFLSATDILLSGELNQPFRPSDMQDKFRNGLKTGDNYLCMNRILNWQISKNMLNKDNSKSERHRPGRPKKNDPGRSISGPKSYYCTSGYLQFLRNFVCTFTPRVILYVKLRDTGILHRALAIVEYIKLVMTRNLAAENFNNGFAKLFPVIKSDFKESKYKKEQKNLLMKNKRQIRELAIEKAADLFPKLNWRSSLYTEFFIFGGLRYHEPLL